MFIPIPSNLKKPIWTILTGIALAGLYLDYSKYHDAGRFIYFLVIWGIATAVFFFGKRKIF